MSTHRPMALLALSLSVLLAACNPDTQPATADPKLTAAQAVPPSAVTADTASMCPDADFETFLRRFGHEIAVQEKSVADPLLSQYNDPDAQPEPRKVTEKIALRDVQWPVMPDPASLGNQREMQVSEQADGSMKVLIRTPDTDDQQSYYFERRPCWTLIKTDDQSL